MLDIYAPGNPRTRLSVLYISFLPTEGPTLPGGAIFHIQIILNFLVLTPTVHQSYQHHLCYRDNSGPPAPVGLIRQLNHPVRGKLCRVHSYPLDIDLAWMWSYWGEKKKIFPRGRVNWGGGWSGGFQFIQPFLKERWRKRKGTDRIVYLRISDWTRTRAEDGGIWGHGTLTMFPGTHLILLRTACSKVRFRTRIVYWNVITPKDASGCITIIPHVLSSVSLLKFLLFLILNIRESGEI